MKAEEIFNVISSINSFLFIIFSVVDIRVSSLFNSGIIPNIGLREQWKRKESLKEYLCNQETLDVEQE